LEQLEYLKPSLKITNYELRITNYKLRKRFDEIVL